MRKSALAICVFMLGWFLLTFPLIGIDYGNIIGTVLFAALIGYIIKMPEVNSGIKKFWHTKCGRIILSAAAAAAAALTVAACKWAGAAGVAVPLAALVGVAAGLAAGALPRARRAHHDDPNHKRPAATVTTAHAPTVEKGGPQ